MPSDDDAVSVTPKYLIGRVTKLTGLSIDVVRVWERRYGAVRPARSGGGTRLYSDADVRRLRRLRQAVDGGHSISQAARLSETELDELIAGSQPSIEAADPYRAARERFLEAIRTMDVVGADQELARAATLFPSRELVRKIVSPLLEEIGQRSTHGEFGLAHEHLASGLLRNMLGSLFRLYTSAVSADSIVLAAPAGERDDLSLWLAALLAAAHGWRVACLGAGLPAAEIAVAVRLINARVLALDITTGSVAIAEELATISSLVPLSTRVWITGAEVARHGALISRSNWVVVRDLDDLDDRLER